MIISRRNVCSGLTVGIVALPAALRAETLRPTPQETLGPFYPFSRPYDQDFDLTRITGRSGRASGEVIELSGRVLRTDGSPAARALIDVWQANAEGRYTNPIDKNLVPLDPNFQGSAKLRTTADGRFRIITIKPGPYPDPTGRMRTRHIHFDVSTADYRLAVQMYFPGEPLNDGDLLFSTMRSRNRDPAAAICRSVGKNAAGMTAYEWDIVMLMA